jgi:diguanylate cyclase (GGDEF)-like protein
VIKDPETPASPERHSLTDLARLGKPNSAGGTPVLQRAAPFVLVALLAEASAALAPEPNAGYPVLLSAILLCLVAGSVALPWSRIPGGIRVVPLLLSVLSVAILIATVGSSELGLLSILLLPVVWTSLYQGRRESGVVVGATALALVVLSVSQHYPVAMIAWGLVVWSGVAVVIATATHNLREQLGHAVDEGSELLRQADALSDAAGRLTSLQDPDLVLTEACRLAAEMVSPAGVLTRRAEYVRVEGGTAYLDFHFDDHDSARARSWPLREHLYLAEVVRTGRPLRAALDLASFGPDLRPVLAATGVTHAAWIPIAPRGVLGGVLTISGRGLPISDQLFRRAVALGDIVQLALSNALAYQRARTEAATDPLTGLANRRGFDLEIVRLRGRRRFAILAIDVDGLKAANDTFGHATGDAVLVGVAGAASRVMRRGDLVARTGGDEFIAFLGDAAEADARRVARRLLEVLRLTQVQGMALSVSVGIACGTSSSETAEIARLADAALYAAKLKGGNCYAVSAAAQPATALAVTD